MLRDGWSSTLVTRSSHWRLGHARMQPVRCGTALGPSGRMMSLRESSLSSSPLPHTALPLDDDRTAKRRCCEGFPCSPSRRVRKARAIPGGYRYLSSTVKHPGHTHTHATTTTAARYLVLTSPNLRNTRSCIMDARSGPKWIAAPFRACSSSLPGRWTTASPAQPLPSQYTSNRS